MGANVSTQNVLNKTMNNVSLSVLNENSTNIASSSDQSNDLTIAGNTGGQTDANGNPISNTITGISQVNSSKINVTALAQSVANNTLQADLVSKLSTTLQQAIPTMATNDNTSQTIKNIVSTDINQNITTKNMTNIAENIKQSNTLKILANSGVDVTQVAQNNEATAIISMINDTNNQILNDIKAQTGIDASTAQTSSSPLDFGIGGSFTIIFIVIIIIIIGGGYYLSTLGWVDVMKPIPLAVIGTMLVSALGGIYLALEPAPAPAST
jgi:hypothetical protein